MSKNLNQINNEIKEVLKKYNFKKSSILVGMAAFIISCGGGGGGGVGTTTTNPTPTNPSTPAATPTAPSNPAPVTNRPTVTAPTVSAIRWNDTGLSYDRSNPHNDSNTTVTGTGVKIGIIDVGFENSEFASDLTEKFGTRITKLTVPDFTATSTESDDHGIIVAALAAGGTEGIANTS